jgi:hypothetical protein
MFYMGKGDKVTKVTCEHRESLAKVRAELLQQQVSAKVR